MLGGVVSVLVGRMIKSLARLGGYAAALALILVAVWASAGSGVAQELSAADRAALLARKDALFEQMLRDPANLDITFAYADISAKLGDNEAAVSALERMLLFNPNLPRVNLELGALYFRMGSYEIARTYFDKALAANPPEEVRTRVETYLGEISQLSSATRLTGYLFFGAQYQSDANLAPGSPLVHSPIGDVLLNGQFVKKPDVNFFGTTSALYSIDLGTQNRDTFEIGGTGFANHYGVVTRLDLGLVEATAGPRFNFPDPISEISIATLKPYLLANDVSLGGNQYFHTLGVGGEATMLAFGDFRFKSVFEFRNKNFNDAPDRPLSRGLQGSDKLVSLFVSKPITTAPASELSLEFDFLAQDTRLAYYTNQTFAGSAAYRIRYDDPIGVLRYPWETTFFFSRSSAGYAAPDPCCVVNGGFITRSDQRWRFGLSQNFQVSRDVAFVVQVQRDIVSSNIPLYAFTSNSVLFGPQIRF